MPFWSHNLKQTAQLKSFSSLSNSGQPSYNSAVDIACRVEFNIENQMTDEGTAENNTSVIFTDAEIKDEDKVVLPDGDEVKLNNVKKLPRLHNPNDVLYRGEF